MSGNFTVNGTTAAGSIYNSKGYIEPQGDNYLSIGSVVDSMMQLSTLQGDTAEESGALLMLFLCDYSEPQGDNKNHVLLQHSQYTFDAGGFNVRISDSAANTNFGASFREAGAGGSTVYPTKLIAPQASPRTDQFTLAALIDLQSESFSLFVDADTASPSVESLAGLTMPTATPANFTTSLLAGHGGGPSYNNYVNNSLFTALLADFRILRYAAHPGASVLTDIIEEYGEHPREKLLSTDGI